MKKLLLLIIMGIIGVASVSGLTDTMYYDTQIPNMYITRVKGSNTRNGAPFMLHKSNGTLVYCIDPFNPDVTGTYTGYTSYNSIIGLTQEQLNEINLIAKFGYGYGNHTDIKWYGITQYLIWQTMLDDIYFTDVYHGSKITAYTSEINEIKNLVKQYKLLPNLNGYSYQIITGDEYTITDTNKVLSNYNINVQGSDLEVNKSGNTLKVKANNSGYYTIELYRRDTNTKNYELYYSANSQNMILPGKVNEVYTSIRFYASKGSLTVQKKDSETVNSQVNNSFEGAVYGLYDYSNNSLIDTVTLDKNGRGYFPKIPLYKYYLQEIKAPEGYKLNKDKYYVTLNQDNDNPTVDVYDEAKKKKVTIHKLYGSDLTNRFFDEENASFGLYDLNNNLIKEYKTDKNGLIEMNIPYGEFIIKQLSSKDSYTLADDIRITVDNELDEYYELYNKEIIKYGNIHITKKGSDGKLLNDVTFELYAADDIVSKDGYIYYHKGDLIDTVTTVNGKLNYNNLFYGKYYLKEIKTSSGYQLLKDNYYFEVAKDDSYLEIINDKIIDKTNIKNTTTNVSVPNTGIKDVDYVETFGVLLLLIGYCLAIYYYKKKKETNLF